MLQPEKDTGVNQYMFFYHGSNDSRAMVMAPPVNAVTEYKYVCKHCGVGKISRHYGVGHGSMPGRPLFMCYF